MNALNRLRTPLTLLGLLLVLLVLPPAVVLAQSDGRVSGIVTNGTTGEPVPGVTVTLSKFESQSPASVDVTTTTGDDGRYAFTGVDTSDGLVHAVSVSYRGALYGSGMLRVNQTPDATADITVYEPTTDDSVISLTARGIILTAVNADTGVVALTDVFAMRNDSDRTLVPNEDGRTLRFTVPANASAVTPRPGFNFGTPSIEGTTVFATSPALPGPINPSLDYEMPYTGASLQIEFIADYPTETTRILVPVSGELSDVTVSAAGVTLLDGGVVDINGGQYHLWETTVLQPDAPLTLTLHGLPASSVEVNRLNRAAPIAIAALALVAAVAVTGWIVAKRGLLAPRPVVLAPALAVPLETRREELAAELRALESEHAAGQVPDDEYRVSRRAILEQLRGISRQLRGAGDDE